MNTNTVICGDCLDTVPMIESSSVHAIITDIPYGIGLDEWDILHENTNSAYGGQSPAQKQSGNVFSKRGKPINGWSEADRQIPAEYYKWCMTWAPLCYDVLRPGGSIVVFAGRRFGHRCIAALEDSGFCLKDILGWTRNTAAHRAQRLSVVYEKRGDQDNALYWQGWRIGNLRPIFEPIIWAVKPYKIGSTIADNVLNHGVGAYNQSAVEDRLGHSNNMFHCPLASTDRGHHAAQKPLRLMELLIELTTQQGHLVLDPFAGSGTTALAALNTKRQFIAIDQSHAYCAIARQRLLEAASD